MTQNRIKRIARITLGLCLVVALSTGAVAADSSSEIPLGDVYFYALYGNDAFAELGLPAIAGTTWTAMDNGYTISFVQDGSKYYIVGNAKAAGSYYHNYGGKMFIVDAKMPTVPVTGKVYNNDAFTIAISSLIGNTANTKNAISINASKFINGILPVAGLTFTNPDGTFTAAEIPDVTAIDASDADNWCFKYTSTNVNAMDLGTWTVQPYFVKGNGFSSLAPTTMLGEKYTFTIVQAETSKKLVASEDEVTQGGYVTITVTAPCDNYLIKVTNAIIPAGQDKVNTSSPYSTTSANLRVSISGVQSFVVKSQTTDDVKVKLCSLTGELYKEITIKVKAGAITATPEKDSVYIGDEFDVDGTNDLGGNLEFYVKGTNYKLSKYPDTAAGKVWSITLDTEKFIDVDNKKPDAGTYTIYITKKNSGYTPELKSTDDFDNSSRVDAYTTISIALIQPFITVNVTQDVVVQDENLAIYGTAEGNPKTVKLYIFGTNFFVTDNASVLDDGTYTYSHKIIGTDREDGDAWKMATGQYFLVVQHPMYDRVYNIGPVAVVAEEGNYNIVLNESGSYQKGGSIIFNTLSRQSSNAAQALIDAIGSQNIDDMQAHLSFIVAGATSYVNAVPSQVLKGQALTVSGTTTGHTNEMVAVELLSTAFAAVPKETVESTAFATLTTRIGDDGVWSVSFDTSNLNTGEYTVSIAVGSLDPVTAKTTIVGGVTPTVTPTPVPTVSPTPNVSTTYTVGIKENSPYSYLNEDGGITGFDVECMRWIATEMGYSVEFKYVDWDNMVTALSSGKCDILSSGLAINQNLTEYMDFTRSYWSLSTDALSKAGKGYTIQNITAGELILGVVRDSTSDEKLELSLGSDVYSQMAEAGKIKYYDTEADILEGLQTNAVNVSIADSTFVKQQIAAFPGIYEVVGTIPETTEKLAAAVKKGNTQLLNQLNKGYARLQSTSTWDRLLKKYGLNGTATPAPADTSDFQLSAGWNFISVPKKLSSAYDTVAELFAGVDFANHALLSYNAETKSWEQLTGSSAISPLNAYWIYSASPVELQYEFDTTPAIPAVKKVYEGWNAVGVSAETPITAKIAFGNTDWYTYITWNAGNQVYNLPFVKGSSGNYADTNTVSLWAGGWLYVNADGNYVGFTA